MQKFYQTSGSYLCRLQAVKYINRGKFVTYEKEAYYALCDVDSNKDFVDLRTGTIFSPKSKIGTNVWINVGKMVVTACKRAKVPDYMTEERINSYLDTVSCHPDLFLGKIEDESER